MKTGTTTPGLILIDNKDLGEHNYKTVYDSLPSKWSILPTENAVTMGDKLRYILELWEKAESWPEWIGLMNDDHVPQSLGWDIELVNDVRNNGKHFVTCNDAWVYGNGRAVGAYCWSSKLIRPLGFLIPPRMQHLYADDVWETLGRECPGLWHERGDVVVEHRHATRTGESDATHQKTYSSASWNSDSQRFAEWRDRGEREKCIEIVNKVLRGEK
jgi:hypothetical protein